jgi:hypothetical protein
MKTDNDYIYPETAEELAMFYGWESENKIGEEWVNPRKLNFWMATSFNHPKAGMSSEYRFKLPTISDLKVGDVVSWIDVESEVNMFDLMVNKEILDELIFGIDQEMAHSVQLLIGRNTWVPIKVT